LKFAASNTQKFDLIELDESTLKTIMESGGTIKASDSDPYAVLCTANNTHKLKLSETSNNIMVIDNSSSAESAQILCTKKCVR